MKKIIVALLTGIYLLSAIGVSVSSFYCCGALKSTHFTIGAFGPGRDSKAAEKTDNCCKTNKQSFKIKDNHFSNGTWFLSAKFFLVLTSQGTVFQLEKLPVGSANITLNSHAPPCQQHAPAYILNCTYRI